MPALHTGRRSLSRRLAAGVLALFLIGLFPAVVAAGGPVAGADSPGQSKGGFKHVPIGYDVSYPQCSKTLPSDVAFGIVGVNRGIVFSPNPCLGAGARPSQLKWAGQEAALYANTGNPGPELSSHWPTGQQQPRFCDPDDRDSAACAYDYGWNAAEDAYHTAVEAYISLGWAEQGADRTPVTNQWWLDVETANSWRDDASLNVASLQGAVDYLESVDVAGVGFYSAPWMWKDITGNTDVFEDYPSWVAGASTLRGAQANCIGPGFTGGGVRLAQYLSGGFDADHPC